MRTSIRRRRSTAQVFLCGSDLSVDWIDVLPCPILTFGHYSQPARVNCPRSAAATVSNSELGSWWAVHELPKKAMRID